MHSHAERGNESRRTRKVNYGTDGLPSAVLDSEEDKAEGKPSVPSEEEN